MLVVGLSGGIAAGKSTVTRLLIHLGIPVIDCDRIAHETSCKVRLLCSDAAAAAVLKLQQWSMSVDASFIAV
jgi:dephospho-CoA kinase